MDASALPELLARRTPNTIPLRRLLQVVGASHPARERLCRADDLVRQVSRSVDESLSQGETGQLLPMLKQLPPKFMQLLAPHRQLVGRHDCAFVGESKVSRKRARRRPCRCQTLVPPRTSFDLARS